MILTVKDIFIINSTVYNIALWVYNMGSDIKYSCTILFEIYIQKLWDMFMYNFILKIKYFIRDMCVRI